MSTHNGKYEWHDDDCLCKTAGGGIEFCNRNGSIWSCCGQTVRDAPCQRGPVEEKVDLAVFYTEARAAAQKAKRKGTVKKKKKDVWFWSGKLPGSRRRRRYRFERIGNEIRIPSRPTTRDDVEPDLPEQAEFLDGQYDVLRRCYGDAWEIETDGPLWDELKRRLEDCEL